MAHFVAVPWKVLVALLPPQNVGGGWPCFVVAISVIGILTALIGDLANLLGCALGLKGSCVAITLVALGTSLPDTFASGPSDISLGSKSSTSTSCTGHTFISDARAAPTLRA